MPGIDDVLERLVTDAAFRAALEHDPRAALTDYDLTDDERGLLASQMTQGAGASGGVERRTSKSGLLGGLLDGPQAAPEAAATGAFADGDGPGTREAETVHAFLKANGTDLQGETS